jgi:hypothetical protein
VDVLAVKLLLAPSFVVGASLTARRFGPRIGGLIAGLPVVAGPILLVYALTHGSRFAAGAAAGTLLGLISLIAFVVVYARLAARISWIASLLAGWAVFAAATAIFSTVSIPAGAALALALAAIALGLAALPAGPRSRRTHPPAPAWDLPLRAACALALVLTLTAVAGWLGPRLSGLLAPARPGGARAAATGDGQRLRRLRHLLLHAGGLPASARHAGVVRARDGRRAADTGPAAGPDRRAAHPCARGARAGARRRQPLGRLTSAILGWPCRRRTWSL